MGSRTFVSIIALLAAGTVAADETPAPRPAPPSVVYLYGSASLKKLKAANPGHFARAERILAAADELCKPGPEQVHYARFEAKQISCEGMVLKTSYPPKREIGFTLDEVRYIALVTINDAEARPRLLRGESDEAVQPLLLIQPIAPAQPASTVQPDAPRIHAKDVLRLETTVMPVEPGK